jgi:hypothetical protein
MRAAALLHEGYLCQWRQTGLPAGERSFAPTETLGPPTVSPGVRVLRRRDSDFALRHEPMGKASVRALTKGTSS